MPCRGPEAVNQERSATISNVMDPTIRDLRAVNERLIVTGLREQQARVEAERLADQHAAVLSRLADGVVVVDATCRVTFVNDAARQLDDTLENGMSLVDGARGGHVLRHDECPCPLGAHAAVLALRGQTVAGMEECARRPDGVEVRVRSSGAPLHAGDGRLVGAVVTLHGVTASFGPEDPDERTPDFVAGDLAVDYRSRRVTLRGRAIRLSPIEYQLLYRLVRNAGRILPVQTLLDRAWGEDTTAGPESVRIYVHRLRAKLESEGGPSHIESVRGIGYRFALPLAPVRRATA